MCSSQESPLGGPTTDREFFWQSQASPEKLLICFYKEVNFYIIFYKTDAPGRWLGVSTTLWLQGDPTLGF